MDEYQVNKPRIQLYSKELVYVQEKDTWDEGLDDQELRINTHNVAPDCNYITIETKRWGLDLEDIDAFCQMLKDALKGLA